MHIYEQLLERTIPILSVIDTDSLYFGTVSDTDRYNAVSSTGIKITSSAPTYGSSYALHPVVSGKTEGTYWLTTSTGQQTLTFDFTDFGGVELEGIAIAPYTRSDTRSNYKISYEVVTEQGVWIDYHTDWVNTAGYKSGEYIRHNIRADVSRIQITLQQVGSWGVTLNDIQFFRHVPKPTETNYMFTPTILVEDRVKDDYYSADGITAISKSEKVDIISYHELYLTDTPIGSEVYYDNSYNDLVEVAYSTNNGVTYSSYVQLVSGEAIPSQVPLKRGTILKFHIKATIQIGKTIPMPRVSIDVPGRVLNVIKLEKPGIIELDVSKCQALTDFVESIKVIVTDGITGKWGRLNSGIFAPVDQVSNLSDWMSVDEYNQSMADPNRVIVPGELMLSFVTDTPILMNALSGIEVQYSHPGNMAGYVGVATNKKPVRATKVKVYTLLEPPALREPIKVPEHTYACTTRSRIPKVTLVKVFRPILKKGNNIYNGVYYSTGLRDMMYQPRQSPLNWVPVKWNGQDI